MDRRTFLGATAGSAVALAGCVGAGGGSEGYGDWFSDVENYDGEADRTGQSQVTVRVGAEDGLKFSPPAIVVDQGTTVRWAWTGQGGRHNVVERDGAFRSEYHDREGATFEHTFRNAGVFPYYCDPHRQLGMKGGVRVEGDGSPPSQAEYLMRGRATGEPCRRMTARCHGDVPPP